MVRHSVGMTTLQGIAKELIRVAMLQWAKPGRALVNLFYIFEMNCG